MASISSILTACASAAGGEIPCTRSTGAALASPASCSSMGESTVPTWPTNRISWHRKTLPCVRSWCAGTSPSMAGCWPGMELFRGYQPVMGARATRDGVMGGSLAAIRPVQATAIRHRPTNRGTPVDTFLFLDKPCTFWHLRIPRDWSAMLIRSHFQAHLSLVRIFKIDQKRRNDVNAL